MSPSTITKCSKFRSYFRTKCKCKFWTYFRTKFKFRSYFRKKFKFRTFCQWQKKSLSRRNWPYLTLIRSYEGTLGPYSIQAPEEETHPDQSDEDDCSTAGLIAIPAAAATIDQREDVLDEMVVSAHVDSEQPDHQSGGWSEDENVWWNEKFCAEELCVDIFKGTESI